MSKKKKDKQKKQKQAEAAVSGELERLRAENEELRARLERIAELAATPIPADQIDDEDEEYDELSRDVDDQIAAAEEPEPATK